VLSAGAVVLAASSSLPQAAATMLSDISTTGMIRFLMDSPWNVPPDATVSEHRDVSRRK
jgi:hypothetical protein